jgi:hypothetical protein
MFKTIIFLVILVLLVSQTFTFHLKCNKGKLLLYEYTSVINSFGGNGEDKKNDTQSFSVDAEISIVK